MIRRLRIREGWATVILTALLTWIGVVSIQRADWADGLGFLTWVMVAGLVTGFIVSKWRQIPSAALHLGGFIIGVFVVVYAMTRYLDDSLGGTREKLRWLWERGEAWVSLIIQGEQAEDLYLFVLFVSVLSYAMAYLTIWFVLRARWVWAAVFFPGVVLLLNMGYSRRVPTGLIILFIFFSLLLLMRFTLLQRELNWRRIRIEYPTTLMWRGLWVASYLALGVIIFGWAVPVSAKSQTAHEVWQDVNGPWQSVEQQFNEWFVGLRGRDGGGVGGFAAFDDSFELGGPLRLSEDPVVTLDGPRRAPYLLAHTYNVYTGAGWHSDLNPPVEEGETREVLPQYELSPGESRPLDDRFNQARERESFEMTLARPRGSLLFSPGSFVSADVGSNLVVSWREVDEGVNVHEAERSDVPAEVWPLVELLKTVDLTPAVLLEPTPTPDPEAEPEASPTPTPEPEPDLSKIPPEVYQMRDNLRDRGILVSFTVNTETYQIQMLNYAGRFPVLHDVEAVYSREGLEEGSAVTVESMVSEARGNDLRAAGQEYPEEIEARYLELPDSVTDRTRALTREIIDPYDNPYDQARAIEIYLRNTIAYNESIDFPPEDVDVVDYVLFTSQEGYCEYYASAMVVMLRSAGIPTRMSTGFFPTDEDTDEGFLYRERNAHAWPEVYFPGYGWIGFEPTAAREEVDRDSEPSAGTTGSGPEGPLLGGEGRAADPVFDDLQDRFFEENVNLPAGTGAIGQGDDEIGATDVAVRVVPMTVLLVILVLAYFWLRGTRGLSPAEQMYTKFARGANWSGVQSEAALTPHEYADRVATKISGSRQPVTYLTDLYVRQTYGTQPVNQVDAMRARQAWLRLRGILVRHMFSRLLFWRKGEDEEYSDDDW